MKNTRRSKIQIKIEPEIRKSKEPSKQETPKNKAKHQNVWQFTVTAFGLAVLFGTYFWYYWKIGDHYTDYQHPVDTLQGILIASTAALAISGAFFTTKLFGVKDIKNKFVKLWAFIITSLYGLSIVIGVTSVMFTITALIDCPNTTPLSADMVMALTKSIRFFFAEIWIFLLAFFVTFMFNNYFILPNDR